MKEKDLLKQILDENLIQKEAIRRRAINTVQIEEKIGRRVVKKRVLVTAIVLVVAAALSVSAYAGVDIYEYNQAESFLGEIGISADSLERSEAKKVYKDIQSDAFEYSSTMDVLNSKAVEMGIENIPQDSRAIYDAIVAYNGLVYTAKISSEQIRAIKAGTSYKDIIKALGNTKDVGSGRYVLVYAVDGDKIFYLGFGGEEEICMQSGEELLKTLEPAQQNNPDEYTFNATMTQRMDNSILVYCPTYDKFDTINLTITGDTEIVFENGEKATIDDIKYNLTITIAPEIRESYPPQGTALKIIVK